MLSRIDLSIKFELPDQQSRVIINFNYLLIYLRKQFLCGMQSN